VEKATYTLLIKLSSEETVEVGSLGYIKFNKGFYSYTGSAFGPGGIKRIFNHIKISEGQKTRKRWHIDYLSSNSSSEIKEIFLTSEKEECRIAERIDAEPIQSFGCSDCKCGSHLRYRDSKLSEKVRESFSKTTQKFEEYRKQEFKIEKNF